jgi:formylglycine-generating enzyme required for sulfatase activity
LEQSVNVTVNKTNPIVNWPENHTVGSSQLILSDNWQLRNINGTQGTFSWANPGAAITNGQQYLMKFMPDDIDNYSIPEDVLVTVIVATPLTSPRGIEMVWIPAGTFTMGSPADERNRGTGDRELQHQVTLTRGFFMGKYQVTQEQWFAVMGTWPSFFTGENNSSNAIVTPVFNRNNLPVEQVSWYDVIVFCNRLSMAEVLIPAYEMQTEADPSVWSSDPGTWGAVPTSSNTRWNAVRIVNNSTGYRLPTEAQWEYACRAGTTTVFYNGNNYADTGYNNDLVGAVAWFHANSSSRSSSRTREVGLKAPNAWGLYDKHGNVFEWCWDWYGNYTSEAKTDPTVPAGSNRVIRGGSWSNDAQYLRSANRDDGWPDNWNDIIGFRLLRP